MIAYSDLHIVRAIPTYTEILNLLTQNINSRKHNMDSDYSNLQKANRISILSNFNRSSFFIFFLSKLYFLITATERNGT